MKAITITALTGPDAAVLADVAPPAAEGLVRIRVESAGVAFPDLLLSHGSYQLKPPPPFIPGSEVAGTVIEAPPESGFTVGDRVAALTMLNGFAEEAVALPDAVYRLPESVSFDEAAALPMNYLTVQFALDRRGAVQPGDTVVVHGAAGGVGTAALQFLRWRGARSIAVVSSPTKESIARDAGADDVVAVDGFRDAVRELTGGRGADIVVDPVGGDRFTDSLRCLAPEGRLLVIGFAAGQIPEVKVNRLLLNNISVVGVSWGSFALATPGYLKQQWEAINPGISSGALRPLLHDTMALDQAAAALRLLETREVRGKIVLKP